MGYSSKELGKLGEELAVTLLSGKGYEIIDRNYRFGRGELDIIALDPGTKETVFVEVKTRDNLHYGEPEYAVTKKKIAQMKRIAELYLVDKNIDKIECRFDVIAILFEKGIPLIEHYINAFD